MGASMPRQNKGRQFMLAFCIWMVKQQRTRGRAWVAIREAVLNAQPLCAHCLHKGRTTVAAEVDHIKPLDKGGTDDAYNLQGLCKPCHEAKTTKDMGYIERTRFDASGRVLW
jgi:5-methylcytosine-specific restriction protein A